jgi:hypothetical protein
MPPNEPDPSPELGLLERLATSDLPLAEAVTLFPRVDRAKKMVEACVRSDAVELVCKRDGGEMVVQPWRLRFVLNDPGTWNGQSEESTIYHLRLRADAHQRYAADREGFYQDLFPQ